MFGAIKKITMELIKSLSATGSKNLPKSVTWLFFLAKYPSRKSVNEAIKKITKTMRYTKLIPVFPNSGKLRFGKKERIKSAIIIKTIAMILVTVILVGVFIIFFKVSIRFYKPCFV